MTAYHSQPPRPSWRDDEENTVHYTDERRETFEEIVSVPDLSDQPPFWGMNAITSVVLEGEIIDEFEYDVVNGHRDPASVTGTYRYEDVVVNFWHNNTLVLSYDLDDLTESDVTWGRLIGAEDVDRADPASQPFLNWLVDNRELAGYLPLEIR